MPEPKNLRERRIEEAREILRALGMPKAQTNVRSARTLLALLDLPADRPWSEASDPELGVHGIMEWIGEHYGFRYAENSRETIRRFTLHQFVQAAIAHSNSDDPDRAVNSPKNAYKVDSAVLGLLRRFGTPEWKPGLEAYLDEVETLRERYAQERERTSVEVRIAPGLVVAHSAGGQNPLIKACVELFVPQFIEEPTILYIGDAGAKTGHFAEKALAELGLTFDAHGQMPDLIVHDGKRDWLVLVEAVTSHGPVNAKRMIELKALFAASRAGLVFVTAFPDRRTFGRYLPEIAWETEVWIAEDPTHLIHWDGKRFLGPY